MVQLQTKSAERYDAIIVGARCAGSATALLLARQGVKVLMVDRSNRLEDALSTHVLMRPAVTRLAQWGLLDDIIAAGTPIVNSTQFTYGMEKVVVPVKADDRVPGLVAPRRWLLDALLLDAAVRAGVEFRNGTSFEGVHVDASGRVDGAELRSKTGETYPVSTDIVIGADGLRSPVASSVGARTITQSIKYTATAYAYVNGVPNQGYRWYYGEKIAAGLIPTNDDAHCFFVSCQPDDFADRIKSEPFDAMLESLEFWEPELARRLSKSEPRERVRRFGGAQGHIRDCAGRGWALVGDAGFFKDPVSAHGISDAFLDAERLTRAFITSPGDISSYQAERDKFAPEMFRVTHEMASLGWSYDGIKSLHKRFSACMKAEQAANIANNTPSVLGIRFSGELA